MTGVNVWWFYLTSQNIPGTIVWHLAMKLCCILLYISRYHFHDNFTLYRRTGLSRIHWAVSPVKVCSKRKFFRKWLHLLTQRPCYPYALIRNGWLGVKHQISYLLTYLLTLIRLYRSADEAKGRNWNVSSKGSATGDQRHMIIMM